MLWLSFIDCLLPALCPLLQVFELMESDLEAVIKDKSLVLSPADVKSYMHMMLQGLGACHKHWVVHRWAQQQRCTHNQTNMQGGSAAVWISDVTTVLSFTSLHASGTLTGGGGSGSAIWSPILNHVFLVHLVHTEM
jgi:hypothetical protein